jgi:hypothetical protein
MAVVSMFNIVSILQRYLPLFIKVLVGRSLVSFREGKSSSTCLEVEITNSSLISLAYESIKEDLKIGNGCVRSTVVRIGNVRRCLY